MKLHLVIACLGGIASAGCSSPDAVSVVQEAYVQASNHDPTDRFGASIAIAADGFTMAIGAPGEDSGGDQADDSASDAGAVYVFVNDGTSWIQQAYVKPSGVHAGDGFGTSVAMSADGSVLAVGAPASWNASPYQIGAIYVFTRDGTTWRQEYPRVYAEPCCGPPQPSWRLGGSVALSADGSTLAAGAVSSLYGQTGPGSVFWYTRARTDTSWTWMGHVSSARNELGASVALSADGSTLAAGDPGDSGGAAYLFTRSGQAWTQRAYLKASNTGAGDGFGGRVALSADGLILAVGAAGEASAAVGIDGDQADDSAPGAGAVYGFAYDGAAWSQQAYVKAPNTGAGDAFGASLALSADGSTLVIGAAGEDSAATGIDQVDDSMIDAGAIYVLERDDTEWAHRTYVKPSTAAAGAAFGASAALTADGSTLVAGAAGTGTAYVFHSPR